VDELIEVLDVCIADLQQDSKALNKLKNSLKTVQHLTKISDEEKKDFRLYIEDTRYMDTSKFGLLNLIRKIHWKSIRRIEEGAGLHLPQPKLHFQIACQEKAKIHHPNLRHPHSNAVLPG